jgi:nucleotide-binding universal stress UspA family protein
VVNTIVVGVDGSSDSRRATEWAAELAAGTGARVVAVHAVGLLEHEPGDPSGAHLAPDLDRWTNALDGLGPDRVERRLVAGEPVGALSTVARDAGADIVVVGSRGVGAHAGGGLGSTSLHLAEAGGVVLVIVPSGRG